MSVKNFVQCGLVTPVAANTVELVLAAPTASYQYPPLDGGTLVIADSVARPTFYEIISYTHRIDNVLYGVVRAKEGTTARSWTGVAWVYQALTAQDYVEALALKAALESPALTGIPTAPTAALGTNTNQIATMAAIKQAIDNLIGGAPGALDALNEFATALGNDPNFATTMTNALAGKEPSIAAGTSAQMWLGNKTWASVLSQVQNTLLTGLGAGSNATIVSTDTLIAALAKIQNQLNNKVASTDTRLTNAREWTATEVTQAEAEAGSATVVRKWSPLRVWQAVLASTLTGINLTLGTAVTAADTVLIAIGKLQKQITDAATNLAGNVRATVLTGYVSGSNAVLASTDTVLAAFGKLQAQITGLGTSKLDANANAVSATKLANARTIALAGDVTGSASFDGSGNVSINAQVADDSHTHSLGNLGLGTAATAGLDNLITTAATQQFGTNNAERVRIDASGNVGIGTTAPAGRLSIAGSASDVWATGSSGGLTFNGVTSGGVSTISTFLDNTSIRIGAGTTQKTGLFINGQTATGGSYVALSAGGAERVRVDSSGLSVANNITQDGVSIRPYGSASSDIRVFKNLAAYTTSTSTSTGTLKITLPFSFNSAMITLKVRGYNYNATGYWEMNLAGYMYEASSAWTVTSADTSGTSTPFTSVRFGHDGTRCCILLGGTSTVLNYPKVIIDELMVSFRGSTLDWSTGWSISQITDETGITITSAPVLNANVPWGAARTLTIGGTGKSVNGNGNVSWTLDEIGAAAASHTHEIATTSTDGFMSAADKAKLNGIAAGAQVNTVTSVASKTGAVTLTKTDVGLGNVDNTSDATKSIGGNAATATKLATGRTIGMTGDVTWTSPAFDGSGNVTAAATLANSGVTAGSYTMVTVNAKGLITGGGWLAAGDIPALDAAKITTGVFAAARIPTLNQNTTGNAATATKLATARTINGVAFDGSANITVADATKLPLTGGNLTGDLVYQNVGVGGWARGLTAKIQSSGAYAAGIGFLGTADSVHAAYLGIGPSPWQSGNGVRVTAAGVTISGATTFDTLITGSVNGNAATATKLQTARSIALAGDVTGSATFDGSSNVSITATVANDSHTHDTRYPVLSAERVLAAVPAGSWVTIAQVPSNGGRAYGEFIVYDNDSGKHNAVKIIASHSYGQSVVACIGGNRYGTRTIAHVRVLYGTADRVYSGAKLQVYIENTCALRVRALMINQINGWSAWSEMTPVVEGTPAGWAEDTTTRYDDITNTATGFSGSFSGSGALLTGLNAANLASGTIPDARLSGTYTGVSITGNAATATKLATARTINGVAFDGSANITISDSTKLPLAGGAMTGTLITKITGHSVGHGGGDGSLSVRGNATSGAVMSFHRPGAYGLNMGLDTDNVFRVGGWTDGENTYRFGVDSAGNFVARGNVVAYSDIRLKKDIRVIPDALAKVEQLSGVTYERIDSGERQTGLIAQEVQKVLPEAVQDAGDYLSVAYGNLVGLLIEAIKELNNKVDSLQAEVVELRRTT